MMFRDPQVILFSSDVLRAARFYERFGFVERFRTPSEGEPIHIDVELDGYRIGFASIDSSREHHGLEPVQDGQRATITVRTYDVPAAVGQLARQGVPVLREPERWLDRLLIAWIQDPDGHPVQLVQEIG